MPAWIVDLFARYGYAVVFFGVFLENTGLPVPGETTVLAGGALAQFGRLSLGWVIVTAVVGATCGDNLGFFIGRRGGRVFAERHGSKIGVTERRLAQFDRYFAQHGAKTVFVARFITGVRVFAAVLAGASGLPWSKFLFYDASGAIVWSIAVATAGYLMAYSWGTLERWIGRAGLAGFVLFLVLVAIGVVRARRQRDNNREI